MSIVVPAPVAAAPPVPNSSDTETTFDAMFEAFLTWCKDTQQPGMNALGTATYTNALDAYNNAVLAEAARIAAQTAAATSTAGSSYKGNWSSLAGALAPPASVTHLGRTWLLTEAVANVALEIPGTSSKWRAYDTVLPLQLVVYNSSGETSLLYDAHYDTTQLPSTAVIFNLKAPSNPGEGAMRVITRGMTAVQTESPLVSFDPNGQSVEYTTTERVVLDQLKTYVLRFMNGTWRFL